MRTRTTPLFRSLSLFFGALLIAPVTMAQCVGLQTPPVEQSFDNNSFPPDCWENQQGWEVGQQGDPGHGAENVADHTGNGGYYAFVDFSDESDARFASDTIDVSGMTNQPEVVYWYFSNNEDNPGDNNDLKVEAWDGSSWQVIDSISQDVPGWTRDSAIVNSANVFNDSIRIRFRAIEATSGDSYYNDLLIDDIQIRELPSCYEPTDLSTSNLSFGSIDLSWVSNGSGTEWQVEYGPSGFTPGNGVDTALVTSTSPTMSGLNSGTAYDFYVREVCSASDSSAWLGPVSASTACLSSVPFHEDFNNSPFSTGEPGSIDPCWSRTPNVDGDYIWLPEMAGEQNSTDTGPIDDIPGSGNYMYTEGSDGSPGDHAILTTPWIDMSSLTLPQFRFYYHFYGVEMDSFFVQIDRGAGWTGLDTIIGEQHSSESADWTPYNQFLSNTVGDTARFRFEAVQGAGYECDYSIDSVTVQEAPSCPFPTDLTANFLSHDSVELTWTSAGSGSEWQIEYGLSGFAPGNGIDTLTVNSTSDTITGLSVTTEYDFSVREVCGAGDTSSWAGPLTAETPCKTSYSTVYHSGFDQTNTDVPLCWYSTGDEVEVVTSSDGGYAPHSPSQMVELNDETGNIHAAVTPKLEGLSDGDKQIRFYGKAEDASSLDELIIGTMSDPTDVSTWVPYDTLLHNEFPGGSSWAERVITLDTARIPDTSDHIGFWNRGDDGGFEIYLDDFSYEPDPDNDVRVASIIRPGPSFCQKDSAQVEVLVENSGTQAESGFDISYSIDGGTPVTESFSQTIQPNSTEEFSFSTYSTFTSAAGTYEISAFTDLATDQINLNDTASHEVLIGSGSLPPVAADPRTIPGDDATIEDTLFVCGTQNQIYECGRILNLRIDSLYHDDALDELQIQLVSPEGTTLDLWMELGDYNEQEMVDLDFTDTASQNITAASGDPYTGTWRPEEAAGFAKFQGEQLTGMWRLRIFNDDFSSSDTAGLHGWRMEILDPDHPQPDLGDRDTICQDGNILLDPGDDPNWSYVWSNNSTDSTLPVTGDFLTAQQSYTYSVTVTDERPLNQCSGSDSVEIYVDTCKTTSIEERGNAGLSFEVRPNPASDRVFIQSKGMNEAFRYDLIDLQGRTIKSKSSEGAQRSSLDVSGLSKGVYLLRGHRLSNGEQLFQKKLVVK